MGNRICAAVLAACMCLLLSGCDFWMDGHYSNVKPHLEENVEGSNRISQVGSYKELLQKMVELVESGRQSTMIYLSGGTQQLLETYMQMACQYVTQFNAIGAYSVDEITYEVGTSGAKPAVAVVITYLHDRSEILRMDKVNTMDQAEELITAALDNCDADVVLRVSYYELLDFQQFVKDYVDNNPQSCMEMPQVKVGVYPDMGDERVIQLSFTYQTSRDSLRSMQSAVKQIFSSAKLYVGEDTAAWEKCSQLYSFLMERYEYKVETSITPPYSLLHHGVGDSKAFATVYAAMCRQAGLTCQVVSGTKAGEPWYWNVLLIDGVYYHVDLLRCSSENGFFVKTENEMSGYVWNYSDYEQKTTA